MSDRPIKHFSPPVPPLPLIKTGQRFYTTEQVAKIIGVDKKTVRNWREQEIFLHDSTSHTGAFLYAIERVEQLKAVYHKNWIYGGHGEVIKSANNFNTTKKLSQSTIEQLKAIEPAQLVAHGVIREAPNFDGKQRGYVCPLCGSGTGQNHNGRGNGAGTFDANNRFYCHACGNEDAGRHKLSTIDLFAISRNLEHENFGEQCRQMANEFSVSIDYEEKKFSFRGRSSSKFKTEIKPPVVDEKELELIHADLNAADESLADFVNFGCEDKKWRGLPLELLRRFGCRYVANWTHPKSRVVNKFSTATPRVLIPCSESYLARLTVPIEDFDEKTRKYISEKEHAGTKTLFNAEALKEEKPIFCVEGYIDAMSIELAGFKAVALGGVNRCDLLVDVVKSSDKKPQVIILLDSDEQGRKHAPQLYDELLNVGCPACVRFLSDDKSKIDCNEILTTQGLERLRGILEKIFDGALAELSAMEEELKARKEENFSEVDLDFYFSGDSSDLDFAYRLERFCGANVRWLDDDEKWLTYSGGLWQRRSEKNSVIVPYGRELANVLTRYAVNEDERKLAAKFKSAKKVGQAISLFKSCDSVRITADDLDKHKNLLNCLNGVVDLETGKFYQHDSKYLITQQCRAAYNPNAKSPIVDNFFKAIQPDEETRQGLLRWLGYCLSGEVKEEKFMIWTGGGGNGKGVLSATVLELLGSYGVGLAPTALLKSNRPYDADKSTTALNGLELVRFAISEEMPADGELELSLIKNLTGGDRINLRKLHAEYRTIRPTAKLNLSGNYTPKIENVHDDGLLRRMLNMPYLVKFGTAENPADPDLKKKLLLPENLNALLRLLVVETVNWYKDGLIISPLMKQETKRHLEQNDFISDFISDYYERGANLSVKAKDFVDALKREYPRECGRFKRNDLIKLISETDGVSYVLDRTKTRIFKGIGKADAPTQQNLEGFDSEPVKEEDLPFDPNDIPFDN